MTRAQSRTLGSHRHLRRPQRPRTRRRLVAGLAAVAAALPLAVSAPPAWASPGGPAPTPKSCPAEQYPAAGAPDPPPAGQAATPYELPFTGSVSGATVTLESPGATLGLDLTHVNSLLCGLVQLPDQHGVVPAGDITFNQGELAITIGGVPSSLFTVETAYIAGGGTLQTKIDPTPAANGGLNVEFYLNAKFTSVFDPTALLGIDPGLAGTLTSGSGGECTLVGGDLSASGVPAQDIPSLLPPQYQSYAYTPVDLTTGVSTVPAGQQQVSSPAYGQPVTGPITAGVAQLVANNFPTAAIDPNTPIAPGAPQPPPGSPACSPSMANALNQLLGLPAPPGATTFTSPSTFAIQQQK